MSRKKVTTRFGKKVHKPAHLNDYVLSTSRMAKTKQTTKSCPQVKCALCKENVAVAKYQEHLLRCAQSRHSCDYVE